ncbi:hypothetical protein RR49_00312 [Microbacterium ginsengisoli]|uniref:Uncharacterized protein n=1 Tax=Microbacterium ginsengisoli TaxID=400772 RepID=A0A0F0LXH6_9MICO|nr:hypothetical protein [Microbacterium ginsengisoli]KJL42014.1 hypothetical protein RR49_00312 [Microbacterium ginsengisoli]MBN9209584.1 hypothetical protein [Microbacterium ginsengisoli]
MLNTSVSPDQGTTLVPSSSSLDQHLGALSRSTQKQVSRGLERLTADVVLAAAQERADAGMALMRAQHSKELAMYVEGAKAELAELHEHGRGLVANTAIHEVTATGALADSVSKAYPIVAPHVWKIVDAQATGSAMTVLRY